MHTTCRSLGRALSWSDNSTQNIKSFRTRFLGERRQQDQMDVPTHDTIGLNIYRELIGRANRSVGTWEKRYGKEVAVPPLPPPSLTYGFLTLRCPLGRH